VAVISDVKICNMALANIGAKSTIESLTENSAEAKRCNLFYDFARQQTLEVFDWNFARGRLTLATHSEVAPSGVWEYRYQYPSDCLNFRYLQNPAGANADAVPYEVEVDAARSTKSILTNLDDAVGVYTFDLTDVTLFSSLFVETFSYALSSKIAIALTGKAGIRDKMIETFASLIRSAPAINANEQMRKPEREADWVEGR
jgi:hypothetical protein